MQHITHVGYADTEENLGIRPTRRAADRRTRSNHAKTAMEGPNRHRIAVVNTTSDK